jgi:hypothetical protein
MPGRNPQEAVDAFLAPLRDALSVLDAHTKIVVSGKRGSFRLGQPYAWHVNDENGVKVGEHLLHAQMRFAIIEADPQKHDGKYRCTTLGYWYKLEHVSGQFRFRAHWHPDGNSPVDFPHVHLPDAPKRHFMTPRISLENVIQWCIEFGAPLRCSAQEAVNRLELAEAGHRLFRSWSNRPSEKTG